MAHKHGHVPSKPVGTFKVDHITFELRRLDGGSHTYRHIAGEAVDGKPHRPLFTGFLDPRKMASDLRALAFEMDKIAALEIMENG